MAFKAGSPLRPTSRRTSLGGFRLKVSHPMNNFALCRGWTLETFSSRND